MIPTARMAGLVSLTLALACCAPAPAPDALPTVDQAARAACRQQAEQSFAIRNRSDLYKPEYGRDSPLSGQAAPSIDRGLVDRYSYGQDYQDCLRSRGARQTPAALPAIAGQPPLPRSPSPGALPPAASPSPNSGPASASDLSRPPALSR